MTATRRDFLKTTAVTLLGAPLLRASQEPRRTLVILQLAGGNDPLNTLVPYADRRYRELRPTLALPERELLPISEGFALHPAMAPLLPLYEQRALAFVQGVGFPTLDRSHFRAQEVWQTADEGCGFDRRSRLGWFGRYADLYLGRSPLSVVALTDRTPSGFAAQTRHAAVARDLAHFRAEVLPAPFLESLRAMYATPHPEPAAEAIRSRGAELFASLDALKDARSVASAIAYPRSPLGDSLRDVAQLLAATGDIAAVWITVGGFDTHANQAARHAALLGDLSQSLAAFHRDLRTRALGERVVVLAWSEFGRRAAENASGGTDHGKGGMVLLMGDAVKGGIHGETPSLRKLDDGDLPSPIDFRSVYASVIEEWLRRDAEPVLGGRYGRLGLFAMSSRANEPA